MEQQHPIPQQISSYQFRLVGDMTLKQFFQLAGGALLSLLFYASKLHPVIKWPLILFFALFGVALAFLPFEDRPLDKWIIAFFRSIYSPTQYYWAKTDKQNYFQDEATPPPDDIVAPQGKEEMEKYLAQTNAPKKPLSKLEQTEAAFLSRVATLFGQPKSAAPTQTQTPQAPSQPATQQAQPAQMVQQPQQKPEEKKDLKIPETKVVRVVTEEKGVPQDKESQQKTPPPPKQTITRVDPSVAQQKQPGNVQQAKFSVDASPPMPPSQPNTISGQVMDSEGKIVEAVILEITDVSGRPVRAVKTNKLGHFYVVTPLQNGTYEIETEKEGLEFDKVKFEASGGIIPPIAIRAKGKSPSNGKGN